MAKRKKKTTHRTHRRRRMSGLGSGMGHDLQEAAGLVLGSVAATIMQRQLTTVNPKLVSGGQVLLGIMLKRHAKSPIMAGAGWGIMGAGAIGLTHEVGLIHGVEDFVNGIGMGAMASDSQMIEGLSNEQSVSGFRNDMYVGDAGGSNDFVNEM